MDIDPRHGFGALYLMACSGALVEFSRRYRRRSQEHVVLKEDRFLSAYLVTMAMLAWAAVLTETYIIYPWYRAVAPTGTASLAAFPQLLFESNAATAAWHSIGMEWKEHVGWLTPIATTMAAAVQIRYGRNLRNHPQLRTAVFAFLLVAFFAAGIAGFFGAMLDEHAPVEGGSLIRLTQGDSR